MPDLSFQIEGASPVAYALVPHLALQLRVSNAARGEQIHVVMLNCQIRIDAPGRAYSGPEGEALGDLFGPPARWGQTLKSLLWAQVSVVVPAFEDTTVVDLPVTCTCDVDVASTRFLHALDDGDVPLTLLFSGTVFHAVDDALTVAPIPWTKEASFRLPVRIWKETMDHYHPNRALLSLDKSVYHRLGKYKMSRGLPTWERALESLLDEHAREPG